MESLIHCQLTVLGKHLESYRIIWTASACFTQNNQSVPETRNKRVRDFFIENFLVHSGIQQIFTIGIYVLKMKFRLI